ncbi:hypothetical protein PBCVKS1B_358R [Paramecium bursaria Chlorella virus KS1B]|nr:hypothetical protein PBCVKS1B_358R [Paramecium bursaria Chlorella virus KS1B]
MIPKIYLFLTILAIAAIIFFWFRMKKGKKEQMSIEQVYHFDVVDKAMGGSGMLSDPIDQS